MNKHQLNKPLELSRQPHFSIRKLNIGAVSVLLGTTLYLASSQTQVVKADTIPDDPDTVQVEQPTTDPAETVSKNDYSDQTKQVNDTQVANASSDTDTSQNNNTNANITDNANDTNSANVNINDIPVTNSAAAKKAPLVKTTTINGLTGEYDTTTDTLTISGTATLTESHRFFGFFDQYGKTVKHLQIKDKIILKDIAASSLFDGLGSLQDIKGLKNLDTSQVTDMYEMFNDCKSLTSLDVSSFDTKQVTDMDNMFNGCKSLTNLNVSGFDTSQVTSMGGMFVGCSALTSLDLSNFDTKQVTYMGAMFNGCKSLTNLNVSDFDTSQVKNMGAMFYNCESLTSLNVSSFDTQQIIDMNFMFYNCESLTSLDLSSFNTKQVIDMTGMFDFCQSLTNIDLSNFATTQATDMDSMFNDCLALNVLKLGPKTYLKPEVELTNPGLWFKQGTKGTLANPEDKQGRTSKDLMASYKPDTEADTYIRGYKYQVNFYDKDDNNHIITTAKPIYIILNQYPVGTDADKGLKINPTAEISTIIKDLENKNYQVTENPFDPEFVPKPEDTEIGIYLTHKTSDQTETSKRKFIVHYQDENGKMLNPDHVQEKQFTRTKTTDLVTNQEKFTDWAITDNQTVAVKVPVITGYITDKAIIPSQIITADKDTELTQVYHKLGQIIPVDKNGNLIANAKTSIYENDPTDPTKIKSDQKVPTVDGYTPLQATINPDDPTKDTKVGYLKANCTIIGFVDQDNHSLHDAITTTVTIGQTITKPVGIDSILTDLANKGYELVTDPFKDQVVATEGKQELNYVFKAPKNSAVTETVTRKQIIHFRDHSGNKLAEDYVTEVKFTRTGIKDTATGKVTWNTWSKAQMLPAVNVPVIKGYITNKTMLPEQQLTGEQDLETTVVYQKLGNYIPVAKDGQPIAGAAKIPYENDPSDPTKIKPDQVLPTIKGYVTPKAPMPKDVTQDTAVTYLVENVPISGSITNTPPDQLPDDVTDTNETPNTAEPEISPAKLDVELIKPTKQHSKSHSIHNATDSQFKSLVNTGTSTTVDDNKNQSLGMSKKQMATLPQTGIKTNNQEALSLIVLGFSLISLSLAAKPKKKYC